MNRKEIIKALEMEISVKEKVKKKGFRMEEWYDWYIAGLRTALNLLKSKSQ